VSVAAQVVKLFVKMGMSVYTQSRQKSLADQVLVVVVRHTEYLLALLEASSWAIAFQFVLMHFSSTADSQDQG
jgi:hypothetical protein